MQDEGLGVKDEVGARERISVEESSGRIFRHTPADEARGSLQPTRIRAMKFLMKIRMDQKNRDLSTAAG
jgi:hypothetical protein